MEGPGNDDRRTLGEPEERGEPHEHDETHAAPKGPPEESRKPDASGEGEGADGRNQGRRQPSHDQLRRKKGEEELTREQGRALYTQKLHLRVVAEPETKQRAPVEAHSEHSEPGGRSAPLSSTAFIWSKVR